MDNFREEIVVKKNRSLNNVLHGLLMFLMVIFALIATMNLSTIFSAFSIPTLVILLLSAGLAVLIFFKKDNLRTEYEYTFTNGELDFARVLGNNKRKNLGSMRVKNVEACGHVTHQSFQRYVTMPGVEKANWFLNRDANLFYFYYVKNAKKHMIIIEPTEEMVALIKQYSSRGAFQG